MKLNHHFCEEQETRSDSEVAEVDHVQALDLMKEDLSEDLVEQEKGFLEGAAASFHDEAEEVHELGLLEEAEDLCFLMMDHLLRVVHEVLLGVQVEGLTVQVVEEVLCQVDLLGVLNWVEEDLVGRQEGPDFEEALGQEVVLEGMRHWEEADHAVVLRLGFVVALYPVVVLEEVHLLQGAPP